MAGLTEKQKRFIEEYLVDLNATQAAVRAGYSRKTANEQGARLLANVSIQSSLQEAMKKRRNRTEITQDLVLDEVAKVALAAASDCTDSDLKYSNKIKALELLGKHLGLFDGRGGQTNAPENNLLTALENTTEEALCTDDLHEIQ